VSGLTLGIVALSVNPTSDGRILLEFSSKSKLAKTGLTDTFLRTRIAKL
jgi:hypothetical protein